MRCPDCGTEISSTRLSCPVCRSLVHRDELESLAKQAETARETGRGRDEILAWRRALELLPPDSDQSRSIAARVGELSRLADAGGESEGPAPKDRSQWKWAGAGALALLAWKLKSVLLFVVTKGKLLLLGLTKSSTFLSMFLSLGVYWAAFGWQFALGLVLSIYVHEMGHVAALHRLGIRASAPMFIPGLGALVRMEQYPVDAREDARVGLAGPIWGLGAAVAAYAIFLATQAPIWAAIARVGAWINLFNLVPIWQLDGGRGFRALSRGERLSITGLLAILLLWTGEGLLVLLLVVAGLRAFGGKAEPRGDRVAFAQFAVLAIALSAMTLIDPGV